MTARSRRSRPNAISTSHYSALISTTIVVLAVGVGSSGATFFVLEGFLGITRKNPFDLYALLFGVLVLFFRIPSRIVFPNFVFLAILIAYFILTSLWSPGHYYRDEKVLKTIVATPALLMAGYLSFRIGGARSLAWGFSGFAIIVSAAVMLKGGVVSSLEMLLDSASGFTLDYQRFGIIAGVGSAMLAPMIASTPRPWYYLVPAVALALLALMSGGRTGAIAVVIAASSYLSWRWGLRTVLLIAATAGGIIFIAFDPLLEAALGLARSAGAPDTVIRAFRAAEALPEITRIWDRPQYIAAAFKVWAENPIFGVGWGGYQTAAGLPDQGGFYPHNLIFEILAEAGLVGFMLLAICAYQILRVLLAFHPRTIEERRDVLLVGTMLTCAIVVAQFVGDWWAQYIMFIGVGAALALKEGFVRKRLFQ